MTTGTELPRNLALRADKSKEVLLDSYGLTGLIEERRVPFESRPFFLDGINPYAVVAIPPQGLRRGDIRYGNWRMGFHYRSFDGSEERGNAENVLMTAAELAQVRSSMAAIKSDMEIRPDAIRTYAGLGQHIVDQTDDRIQGVARRKRYAQPFAYVELRSDERRDWTAAQVVGEWKTPQHTARGNRRKVVTPSSITPAYLIAGELSDGGSDTGFMLDEQWLLTEGNEVRRLEPWLAKGSEFGTGAQIDWTFNG